MRVGIKMLNELKGKKREKMGGERSKNEKVRVGDVKNFEEIMKRCRKESSMAGRRIWKIENRVKERESFKSLNLEIERNGEKGGLFEEDIKN